ncbi:hypothetical protein AB0H98_30650 [Nocardia salmonicida]|uniref:hypothetical protein n=1 Tax=Nocardia salmonicida TaxID=53431 RepID=UPI00340A4F19
MDEFELFVVGDRIAWWADSHGRGLEPEAPGARQGTGTVRGVIRDRVGEGPAVALIVDCQGILGSYQYVVRPDYGHRPKLANSPVPQQHQQQ